MSTPTPLHTILSWFQTGDFPTETQFKETFLSFYHKEDLIPIEGIERFEEIFQLFAIAEAFQQHLTDPNAHSGYLALLNASNLTSTHVNNWKSRLGITNVATIDSSDQLGNVYTKIQVNGFVDELKDADKDLALEIEKIKNRLLSNDLSLDELQEIVDYIKENREQIELLKEDIIRGSSDDKINLVGSYSNWGAITYQNKFNDLVYDKIKNIEDAASSEKIKYEERIRGDSMIKHNLDTLSFVIDAYDTVTMFTIPLKVRRIDTNTIEVLFDSIPPNIIKLTIKKI
ncbi:hypothetical protein A0O34_16680 [Chryseobacterium glaciei]|uniref:Uncharacterized protein n=1 Tax=Chryseobacterium glaciei TaxID=1685010 RepID=A0A172XYF6_9FLAO|nr:hypothetical protein [Chryseobacterium glaciei]ANF52049.1 hypothetical protein A0O34_16680 [Chryseobacterium glaciei]